MVSTLTFRRVARKETKKLQICPLLGSSFGLRKVLPSLKQA
jgi:hypothetical protein